MAKAKREALSTTYGNKLFLFLGGITIVLFVVMASWSNSKPWLSFRNPPIRSNHVSIVEESKKTFYDDPELSYTIDKPIKNWDEKRKEWLNQHSSFSVGASKRILLVTGSQPSPCKNPFGDHLLLRFFKNKVDYCRIHNYDIFYNNAFLHQQMPSYWAKIPVVRAAMLAHPEVEWIWWVDSDAMFTDMDFKLPLERYKDHNFVLDGWPNMIYERKSWIGVNAGVFLIRNCQWSMDFMDVWANMGPKSPKYETWGKILAKTLTDKMFPIADDQSALAYLLLKEKDTWAKKIYIENEYCFQGYWEGIVGTFENISNNYAELEKNVKKLRRRYAEKLQGSNFAMWEKYLEDKGYRKGKGKRPFVTHFTGCQPCSGDHNPMYGDDSCWKGIERALNFADNQVLRNYGFVHSNLRDSSLLPL